MSCYEFARSRSANIADLGIEVSSLYLLAAPSTPEKARVEVLRRAGAEGRLPHAEVKRIVAEARGHPVDDSGIKPRTSVREAIKRVGLASFASLPAVEMDKIVEMARRNITAAVRQDTSAAIEDAVRRQGWKLPYRHLIDALNALDALNPSDAMEKSSIKKVVGAFPLDDFVTVARIERAIEFLVKLLVKLGPTQSESKNSVVSIVTTLDKLPSQARETNSKTTSRPIRRRSSKPFGPE
jgi:hypothetical protein